MNQTMRRPKKSGAIGTYLRVTHVAGVTLRMAGEIVKALQPLNANTTFVHEGVLANARSILSIVCLAAGRGAKVYVWAEGPDAPRAIEIVTKAFAGGLGVNRAAT